MPETLLTPSSIKLYGRVLSNLTYVDDTPTIGANNFLQRQFAGGPITTFGTTNIATSTVTAVGSTAGLVAGMTVSAKSNMQDVFNQGTTIIPPITYNTFNVSSNPVVGAPNVTIVAYVKTYFARIYAFSFEGAIYGMPKPAIFLVHGTGTAIDFAAAPHRSNVDQSGVAAREWEFSGGQSVSYWEYEKGDFSLRLDTEAGPLEQILLAAAIRGADMADRSGANLGIRSGANLSGANVSGANVSGANVSGANVSGANLRNR